MISRATAACLLGLLVAACADPTAFLPKPYQPANKGAYRVSQLVLADHIVVPPVPGLNPELAKALQGAVLDELIAGDFIATSTKPTQRTSRLYGAVSATSETPTQIRWTLVDPYGQTLANFQVPSPETEAAVGQAARTTVRNIIVALHQREPARPVNAASASATEAAYPRRTEKLMVTAIFDAPAGGAAPLRQAMTHALTHVGFQVVNRPDDDTWHVQCTVSVTESGEGSEQLALSWEVKSASGKTAVTIDQANQIPAGSLQDGWSDLSVPITLGAATGILAFFKSQQPGLQP